MLWCDCAHPQTRALILLVLSLSLNRALVLLAHSGSRIARHLASHYLVNCNRLMLPVNPIRTTLSSSPTHPVVLYGIPTHLATLFASPTRLAVLSGVLAHSCTVVSPITQTPILLAHEFISLVHLSSRITCSLSCTHALVHTLSLLCTLTFGLAHSRDSRFPVSSSVRTLVTLTLAISI